MPQLSGVRLAAAAGPPIKFNQQVGHRPPRLPPADRPQGSHPRNWGHRFPLAPITRYPRRGPPANRAVPIFLSFPILHCDNSIHSGPPPRDREGELRRHFFITRFAPPADPSSIHNSSIPADAAAVRLEVSGVIALPFRKIQKPSNPPSAPRDGKPKEPSWTPQISPPQRVPPCRYGFVSVHDNPFIPSASA